MRELIENELRLSAAVILAGEEVVPRFRIEVAGEAAYMLFVPLPDDLAQRQWRLALVSAFMAWKGAHAFVMSMELTVPDAAASVAVSRSGVLACWREYGRSNVSRWQWGRWSGCRATTWGTRCLLCCRPGRRRSRPRC